MIRYFLKGLPYTLTQPMFREFEAKQRELQQWIKFSKSEEVKKYLRQIETIEYIFALGIYYRYVIAPLTKAQNFFDRVDSSREAGLLVGGREIGSKFRESIYSAELHFDGVIQEYGLHEHFFTITDVKQIVMSLIEIDKRRQDGPE